MIKLSFKLVAVGFLKNGPEYDLVQKYRERLSHFEIIELKSSTKENEAKLILKHIKETDYIIGLDEKGKDFTSQDFSELLYQKLENYKNLCFLIGGADGLSFDIKQRCHTLICFGKLTWPHMLVRGLLCEQVYRASLILNHHPYHRN